MSNVVEELASFACSVSLDRLPSQLVQEARRNLVDTVGVILIGGADPRIRALARRMTEDSTKPTSTILGTGLKADPIFAAMVNGAAGVWHDFDAGNRFLGGHPAIHTIAAGLALGEQEDVPGCRFLEAIVAGYEVGARVGYGTIMRPEMHPHGTWANLGAAATSALLREMSESLLRETLNISTSLTLATSWQTAYQGVTVRNAYAGVGATMGVLATDLAASGFTGERDGISTVFGKVSGLGFDAGKALEGLGQEWLLAKGYRKMHASARHIHSALDALIALDRHSSLDPDQIDSIQVRTFGMAAGMNDPAPRTGLAAKFSVPHVLAAYLLMRETGIPAFEDEVVHDPRIGALASRVEVMEDSEMEARTPGLRQASLLVRLRSGDMLSGAVDLPRGDYGGDSVSDEELNSKFLGLASPVLGSDKAEHLLQLLWRIEELPSVRQLAVLASGGVM